MKAVTEARAIFDGMVEQMAERLESPYPVVVGMVIQFATLTLYEQWGREKTDHLLRTLRTELEFLDTVEGFRDGVPTEYGTLIFSRKED